MCDIQKKKISQNAPESTITIMKGRETPKNQALTILKGFSTVSEEILFFPNPAGQKAMLRLSVE